MPVLPYLCVGAAKQCPQDCLRNSNLDVPWQMRIENDYLDIYECMLSQNKDYKLCYQSNGDVVLYDQGNKPIWCAGAAGAGGGKGVGV